MYMYTIMNVIMYNVTIRHVLFFVRIYTEGKFKDLEKR